MNILKNTKTLLIMIAVIGSATLLSGCTNEKSPLSAVENVEAPSVVTPDRSADINGLVRSIEGNEITVASEIKNIEELTDEEREAQKEERAAQKANKQNLTQEEKRALKEEATANLETKNITLTIPIGAPIVKGFGVVGAENILAELSEIKTGIYVSMWLDDNGQVEAVKLKGVN